MSERPDGGESVPSLESAHPCGRYLALRDAVGVGILEVDVDGLVVDASDAFLEVGAYESDDLRGEPLSAVMDEPAVDGFDHPVAALRETERDAITVERPLRTGTDESVPCTWRFAPVDVEGERRGAVVVTETEPERFDPVDAHRLQSTVSQTVAEASSPADGLDTAFQIVCEQIGWEYCEAWFPADNGDILERARCTYCTSTRGDRFDERSAGVAFERGEGLPGRVWETGEPEWLPDVSSSDEFVRADAAAAAGLRAALGVPVVADGQVLAVLVFATAERLPADDRLIETLVSVGAGLGGLVVRQRTESTLEDERELLDRLLTASPVAIGVFDADGSIERINERAAALLEVDLGPDGDTPPAIADRPMFDADGEPLSVEERPVGRVLETAEPVDGQEIQVEVRHGERRWFSVNATPITDEAGELVRVVATGTDITRLKEQTRRLERQRDDLRSELEDVFERVSDGFYALDDEWRFTYVNERAEELLGRAAEDLLGANVWSEFPNPERRARYERAIETGTPSTFEEYSDTAAGWFEVRLYPSDTGLSVYFRDVSERRVQDRKLRKSERRYRTLVENFPNGAVGLFDDDLQYTVAGGDVLEELSVSPEEIIGRSVEDRSPDDEADRLEAKFQAVFDGERNIFEYELHDRHWLAHTIPVEDDDGDIFAGMVMVQDITDRKEMERDLRESEAKFRTVAENLDEIVWMTTPDTTEFLYVNPTYEDVFGRAREELYEDPYAFAAALHPEDREHVLEQWELLPDGAGDVECRILRPDGDRRWIHARTTSVYDEDGEVTRIVGVANDVTERVERERELERYETIVETITDGVFVLDEDDRFVMVNDGHVELTGYSREELLGEHASLITGEEVTAEARRRAEELTTDDERAHVSMEAPVERADGELVPTESRITVLTDEDGSVRGRIGVARDVSERVEHQRQLERQREQLAALNELNDVFRETTEAIIEQSTREEIEEIVCERLADSSSYLFAWVGEVDPGTDTVRPRAQAGVGDLLAELTISADPDDPGGGPTPVAVRDRELQTTSQLLDDPVYEPWRGRLEADDVQSAAIPIVHEETLYGVLTVYAERPNAFTADERAVVGQLGEIVGHAIAAVERKRALLSDDAIELEFRIRDFFETMGLSVTDGGRIEFDRTVPVGDGEYLVYGTTGEDGLSLLEEMVDRRSHWTDVNVIAERFDDVTFEVRMSESPLLSAITPHGGSRGRLVIDGGNLWMTLHVPQGSDVRQVIDAVRSVYPRAEATARRQISTSADGSRGIGRAWSEALTDRQRTALETAYHAGFFEWPRHSSGEDVADALGVTPPTFHQHVRAAERKLFGALFGDHAPSG